MDDLLTEFIAETRETLESVAGELVAWEADPADRDRLDAIFRFVHTVKGSCGFLDLPRLEKLSHAAEDALSQVREGQRKPDAPLVSAVLAIVDRIGELAEAIATGEAVPDGDEALIAALAPDYAPPVETAEIAVATQKGAARSIRISVDLLDRMMAGVSDLVLARNELSRRLQDEGADPVIEAAFDRLSGTVADIRDAVTRTRMQRIEKLFAAIPRLVRDLSAELGKHVTLEIDGGDVELDREMIELIRDPLTHMIRNALDHGIETPEERAAAGKKSHGKLRLGARQSGNQILIELSDDGRGIDGDRLVAKAIAAGALTQARADRMTPEAKVELVFQPGLTTAQAVTAISGRGVGMDVVRSNIERIGGIVELASEPGQGVSICIRVPLTLTIIPALTVSAGAQHFALPRSAIREIVRETSAAVTIERVGEARVARLRAERLPIVELEAALSLPRGDSRSARSLVVLNPAGGADFAVSVEGLHDHQELVVRPACPAIMASGVYAGMTLPDTGKPMLLLDPAGLAAKAGVEALQVEDEAVEETLTQDAARVSALVFRDLDGATRAVRLGVVERIEDVTGAQVRFAAGKLRLSIDGRIIPLMGFDTLTDRDTVSVLRLNDGRVELAYAIEEVVDIVALPVEFQNAAQPGIVAGVTLHDGIQIELLDPYWLFAEAQAGGSGDAAERPLCLLPESDDPWTNEVLRPLVEAAGYRVALGAEIDPAAADIVIAASATAVAAAVPPAKLLRLRPEIAAREADDASVYRYDRAGLMSALQAGRGRA